MKRKRLFIFLGTMTVIGGVLAVASVFQGMPAGLDRAGLSLILAAGLGMVLADNEDE